MKLPRVSLKLILILSFAVQTCLAVGLVSFIFYRNSRQDIANLAEQLQKEVSLRVVQELDHYLSLPHKINQINAKAIAQGVLSTKNFDQLCQVFLAQMQAFPVGYINFGNPRGEFIGIERLDDGQLRINKIQAKTGISNLLIYDTQGRLLEANPNSPVLINEAWYTDAVQAQQPIWSDIYTWEDKPDVISISASMPIYDRQNQLEGVIGVDLILSQFSDFLNDIQLTPRSRIFLVERSGLLIASSGKVIPFQIRDGKAVRLNASDSPDPMTRSASNFLVNRFGSLANTDTHKQLVFTDNQEQFFVRVTPYRDEYGLDWLIVVAVPEMDFMAQVHENTRLTWVLWLMTGVIALVIGLLTARWIARPIYRLSEETQNIAQDLEFASANWQIDRRAESSWIRELGGLSWSFNQMASRLQEVLDKLHQQAYYDPLTGIANQNLLSKRIKECIERSQDFVLFSLDIDRFKSLKYAYGHQIAEHLLVEISRRLSQCLSPKDTLARIGVDAFGILFCDLADRQAIAVKAEALHQQIVAPLAINGSLISNPSSIGVVSSQIGETAPETYLHAADTAMHYAKLWGKGKTVFYNPGMQTLVAERLQLEADLKQAIAAEQLHLNYQPIVSMQTGRIVSFEALVRWQHPRRGMMPPHKFISIAEETGLIIPLGRWVMSAACQQILRLHNDLPDQFPLSIGVNISEVQLRDPQLIAEVDELVQTVPPHSLKLELTETCLMENTDVMQGILEELKSRSIQLLIDDFGTGYSSLSYLQRLPVDSLKIDRSFITGIEHNQRHLDITRAIITLAHSLGMDVVAEGIENPYQAEILANLGCEYGQGYYFSPPMPESAVIPFLQKPQSWL
jgi:diguanylate cyclase (GGDEF)-like protein